MASLVWHVMQSKPQQEHRALRGLQRHHYTCYLPVIEKAGSDRAGGPAEPLFARYLFIRLASSHADDLMGCGIAGVSRLLKVSGKFATVPDAWIAALQHQLRDDAFYLSEAVTMRDNDAWYSSPAMLGRAGCGQVRAMRLIDALSKDALSRPGDGIVRQAV